MDRLVGFFCVLFGKNRFWLVWLINLFNRSQTGLTDGRNSICLIMLRDCSSHNDYSQELTRSNQKRLEKCSTEKGQAYQPKPAAVKTVDPNRLRPKFYSNMVKQSVLMRTSILIRNTADHYKDYSESIERQHRSSSLTYALYADAVGCC